MNEIANSAQSKYPITVIVRENIPGSFSLI